MLNLVYPAMILAEISKFKHTVYSFFRSKDRSIWKYQKQSLSKFWLSHIKIWRHKNHDKSDKREIETKEKKTKTNKLF